MHMTTARTHLLLLTAGLLVGLPAGCRGQTESGRSHPPVLKLLMPLGGKQAVITVERKQTHTGYTRTMTPRKLEVSRTKSGVVYRVRERTGPQSWRLAAQLLVDAHKSGAYIRAQYGLGGKRVGPKTPRLLFPWPPKPGTPRTVKYAIADGRKAEGTVTVLRYGFSRIVAGRSYQPCLEVREVLRFAKGGGIDLRSVYCVGFGRVEMESRVQRVGKDARTTVDRSTGLLKK